MLGFFKNRREIGSEKESSSGLKEMVQVFFTELKGQHGTLNAKDISSIPIQKSLKEAQLLNQSVEDFMSNFAQFNYPTQSLHQFFSDVLSNPKWKWETITTNYSGPDRVSLDWDTLAAEFLEIMEFLSDQSHRLQGKECRFSLSEDPEGNKLLVTVVCPDLFSDQIFFQRQFGMNATVKRKVDRFSKSCEINGLGTKIVMEIDQFRQD
jgi:hypothetical protein